MTLAGIILLAQLACGDHTAIVRNLKENYGETRISRGLIGYNYILEIWANEVTGSWTILDTNTNGVTCIRAIGRHWTMDEVGIRT